MLQSIRDRSQGWFAWTIIGALIIPFALWGVSSYIGGGGSDTAVKVNGQSISQNAVSNRANMIQNQLARQGLSPLPSSKQLFSLGLGQLIKETLLTQAATKDGYVVSPEVLEAGIASLAKTIPPDQFLDELGRSFGYSPVEMAHYISNVLLLSQQFPRGLQESAFVLPGEVKELTAFQSQERNINYFVIPMAAFLKQMPPIPNDQLLAYYNQHLDDFKTQPSVTIQYVELSRDAFKGNNDAYQQAMEQLTNLSYQQAYSLDGVSKQLHLPLQTAALTPASTTDLGKSADVVKAAFSDKVLNNHQNSAVIPLTANTSIVLRVQQSTPAKVLPFDAVKTKVESAMQLVNASQAIQALAQQLQSTLAAGGSISDNELNHYGILSYMPGFISRSDKKVNPAIIALSYTLPPTALPSYSVGVTPLPNGDVALVRLNSIRDGSSAVSPSLTTQLAADNADMDYLAYRNGLLQKAKIKKSANLTY